MLRLLLSMRLRCLLGMPGARCAVKFVDAFPDKPGTKGRGLHNSAVSVSQHNNAPVKTTLTPTRKDSKTLVTGVPW